MDVTGPGRHEPRFIALALAASVALHAALLALGPRMVRELPFEPPQVLSVVLADPAPATEVAPPPAEVAPPPPAAPRPAARRPPRAVEEPRPRTEPPPATSPAASPAPLLVDPGPKDDRPAEAAAAASAPAAAPPVALAPVAAPPRATASPPDFRAAYLRNPPPGYPAAARRNGEEGTVTLRVLVSTDGTPREVALERSSGSSILDAAALGTVKNWRFVPARRGGEAQEAWVLVPVVFRLEPRG